MKKIFNYWAIFLVISIWFIFSSPFFIKGLAPYPSLYQSDFFSPWSAYSIYKGPTKNNAMPDLITQIYPWRDFTIDTLKNGRIPLWNPYSFSGTPHLANYQSASLFPLNILFFIPIGFINSWSLLVLLQPLLAGIGMYILLKNYRLSEASCAIGAISFMFSGFMVAWMGYATLGYSIAFLPVAFYSVNKFLEKQKFRYGLLLSISIVATLFSGHFQTGTYFLIALFSYILFALRKDKISKSSVLLIIYFISGLLMSMPQILPSMEFYFNSVRQGIVARIEVIPLQYIPTLFAPDIFGNPVTRNNWFGHYAEWNGFAGTLPLILGILSGIFFWKKDRRILFFVFMALISLLIAFDTPLNLLLFKMNLPLFSTSASSRIIVLFSFAIAVLSSFGIEYLVRDVKKISIRRIAFFGIVPLVIIVISWMIPLSGFIDSQDKIQVALNNLVLPTAMTVVFGVGLLALYFFRKKKKIVLIFLLLILAIVSIDMLRFANKWMPFEPKDLVFKETGIGKFYKENKTEYRYHGIFSAENSLYYRIQSLGGYDPLYPKRYGEFVKYVDLGKKISGDRSGVNFPLNSPRTEKAIDFLGVKYVQQKKLDRNKSWAFDFSSYPKEKFKLIYEDEAYSVFENNNVFPRAFIVNDYKIEANDEDILRAMFDVDTNLRDTVILEKHPGIETNESNLSNSKILNYEDNSIEILVESENDALLVLTDNYYPGWRAIINGKDTEIFRANYTFRAIKVPKGNSKIKFIYEPDSFEYGKYMFLLGLAIIIGSYIYLKKYEFRN